MSKQQQKKQAIQAFQRRIQSREKPEMRITKERKRRLLVGAVVADLVDAGIGIFAVVGDLASPLVIDWFFKKWFQRYDVEPSEFRSEGTGGQLGYIGTQSLDFVISLFPIVGDVADLFFTATTYKIYSTVKAIRNKDETKIENYKQWRRTQEQILRREIARIEVGNIPKSAQAEQNTESGQEPE